MDQILSAWLIEYVEVGIGKVIKIGHSKYVSFSCM